MKSQKPLAFDTETTGLSLRHGCKPYFLILQELNTNPVAFEWDVDPSNRTPIIPQEDIEDIACRFKGTQAIGFNVKFDLLALEVIGVPVYDIVGWDNIHDVMLMSHAYESGGNHGLKELCIRHLGLLDEDERLLGKATKSARHIAKKLGWDIAKPGHPHFPMVKKFSERNSAWKADMWLPRAIAKYQNRPEDDPWWSVLSDYAVLDGKRTLDLYIHLKKLLEDEDLWEQYEKNRKLIRVTYEMERRGVSMRTSVVKAERMRFQKMARAYGLKAKRAIHRPGVNLRSGEQLIELLYKEYKLPVLEVTSKKQPSTSADTLAKLYPIAPPEVQELIENVIISRKFNKGLEYLENFSGFLLGDHVHPNIRITGTSVTRMSVNDPPLQTVGKLLGAKEHWPDALKDALTKAGVNLRRCFGPAKGREWAAIDLSQAHPRIFAWMSGDLEAQEVFLSGKDYYLHLASGLYGIPQEEVTKQQRSLCKTLSLADLYGSGDAKLEKVTGTPGLKKKLAEAFPTRALYIAKVQDSVKGKGYVNTAGGYRLYCPETHKTVNYVVLGTEGEVMKEALAECWDFLEKIRTSAYDPYVAMQIHDELLIDLPSADRERNLAVIRECASIMENTAKRYGAVIPAEITIIREDKGWNEGEKIT